MRLNSKLRDMSVVFRSPSEEHGTQMLKTCETLQKVRDRFDTFRKKMKFAVVVIDDTLVRMAIKRESKNHVRCEV